MRRLVLVLALLLLPTAAHAGGLPSLPGIIWTPVFFCSHKAPGCSIIGVFTTHLVVDRVNEIYYSVLANDRVTYVFAPFPSAPGDILPLGTFAQPCTSCQGVTLWFAGHTIDNGGSSPEPVDFGIYFPQTTTPEPATLVLLASGLGALGFVRRLRRVGPRRP